MDEQNEMDERIDADDSNNRDLQHQYDMESDEKKWRPIATAPQDGTRVIVFDSTAKDYEHKVRIDSWDYLGRDKNDHSVYGWDGKPTHWMPLPSELEMGDGYRDGVAGTPPKDQLSQECK